MKHKDESGKSKTPPAPRRQREKSKKFAQLEVTKTNQITLFDLEPEEENYSQSIELNDFIPKYVWGKVERLNDKFLG